MDKKRVGFIDEIRGFAILCMVFYHIMFDLNYYYNIDIPIFMDSWFAVVRDVFAGLFIFISGVACRYSHNNMRRGIQCFFIGMCVTYVCAFVSDVPITFGILHCLGVCMMIYGVWEKLFLKIKARTGIIVNIILFMVTFNIPMGFIGISTTFGIKLPSVLYSTSVLFPLGLRNASYEALDYFPLLPWLFLMFAGAYFGEYVKNGKMPAFFYQTHVKWLAFVGRNTLIIYLAHQPLAMLLMWLLTPLLTNGQATSLPIS